MATYVNNLRLKEIATGDESGTWGTSTNTNLELIADALGSGTEAITTNADAHTTTIADGAADEGRALFLKYTGTLDSACTITLGPNTVNKLWFVENATSGSQNIIISQGSGANITIAAGKIAIVYTDGAGSGAAVLDALADLELSSTLSVAGATTLTGVTTHGGNVVSDTDSTDDLGTTGVRWANLWVDAITMGGTLAGAVATFSSTVGITGVTTHGGNVVSDADSTDDLGTTGVRWANLYVDDVVATTTVKPGTLVLAAGSITDTSGAITFVNENLVTTGTLGSGALTASTISGTDITASGDVIIGANPASSGDIRLNKDFQVYTRNNANDANKVVISENVLTGNDTMDIGDNTKWTAIRFHVSTLNVMELTSSAINLNKAVTASDHVTMASTKKLYLDGGGDTYLGEQSADDFHIVVGDSELMRLVGNTVRFPGAYANTTGSAVNMFVSSSGDLARSTSSLRYKTDIAGYELDRAQSLIAGLEPISYRHKDEDHHHLGFTAEQVSPLEPLLVALNEDGEPDSLEYERLVVPLTAVVQSQMSEIAALTDRIAALEA